MKINEYKEKLLCGSLDGKLSVLYAEDALPSQKKRYLEALERFRDLFPERDEIRVFSASGRTEIGGNHTDHQHGFVLAAAVDLDTVGVFSFHDEGVVRVRSEGYRPFDIDLDDLEVHNGEKGTPAIVRGILAGFRNTCTVSGFDVYVTSDVVSGSGLSSSAAFENLFSAAIDICFNEGKSGAVGRAKTGQFAENVYFGKSSGLMDQLVSAVGGSVLMDFRNTDDPSVEKIHFDPDAFKYKLIITNTKGSHSDLTDDYSEIRNDMESVAACFGKEVLRDVDEENFRKNIALVREKTSDRAVLRAVHFFNDSRRAFLEAECLKAKDFEGFISLVRESGISSETLLQNLYSVKTPSKQEIPLALMAAKDVLKGRGAVRVHGGGFAGTIQAFVPYDLVDEYKETMNGLFGDDSCFILSVRDCGGTEVC